MTQNKPPVINLSKEITNPVPKPKMNPKLSVKEKTKALEGQTEDKKPKSKPNKNSENKIFECGLTNTTAQQIKRSHNDVGSPTSPETKSSPKKTKIALIVIYRMASTKANGRLFDRDAC